MKNTSIKARHFLFLIASLISLFSCSEKKELNAAFIQTDFIKGEDPKPYMKDHIYREKAGQLDKMESEVLAKLPVQHAPYKLSPYINASQDIEGNPMPSTISYTYTMEAPEGSTGEDKVIFVTLNDLNGSCEAYLNGNNSTIGSVGTIMKDTKLKNKKVFDVDTFSNCFGIEYMESSLTGVQDLNTVLFLYDRFLISMWCQGNTVKIEEMKAIAAETAMALAPFRAQAYPSISITELPGTWKITGAEITQEFIDKNTTEAMQLIQPNSKEIFINNINENVIGKWEYTFQKNNFVSLKVAGEEKAKGVFESKIDTVFFNLEGIESKMYKRNDGTWALQSNRQSVPIFHLKKAE